MKAGLLQCLFSFPTSTHEHRIPFPMARAPPPHPLSPSLLAVLQGDGPEWSTPRSSHLDAGHYKFSIHQLLSLWPLLFPCSAECYYSSEQLINIDKAHNLWRKPRNIGQGRIDPKLCLTKLQSD
jgi:hypothetical protein